MPLPSSRSRHRRVLTGSALHIGDRSKLLSGYTERLSMPWQQRALLMIDLIPELEYASRFYSRLLEQVHFFPAFKMPDGSIEQIVEGPAVDLLDRIQDASGGKQQILSNYGRLMFITGEGNLLGHHLNTEDESWVFVWNDEVSVVRGKDDTITKIIWRPFDAGPPLEFSRDEAVVYKFWIPHPRRSGEATSPLRAIIEGDIAEELIALTRSVRSTAISRTTRGILILPQEIQPPPASFEGDEDPEVNPWITEIADHLEAQIEHAGSAAAAAPYLMEVPFEYVNGIRLIELHNPQHDYLERELRREAVERIAHGIDFPPEALTGLGSTNHWAALQILMDMWRSHGAPIAQRFASDLASAYLRPALREMGFERWKDVVIGFDGSAITVKPDRSDDARLAIREGAIGQRGLRKLLNIPEELRPTEEEIRLMLELRRGKLSDKSSEQGESDTVLNGPPPPGPEGDSGRRTRIVGSANGSNIDAVELALMRCRELAGIRIRQKAQRHFPEYFAQCENVPYGSTAATLGMDALKKMGLSNTLALVSGGADNLRSLLVAKGYSQEQADLFAEIIEVHAARTLMEESLPRIPEQTFSVIDWERAA